MFFNLGGGVEWPGCRFRGQYPRAAKNPLKNARQNPPPFWNLALGGF